MLKKILIGLAIIIALLVIVIATRPDDFRVTRSATMKASPEAVFNQVNDLKKWNAWSPWAKMDPKMVQTYDGPESGKGAVSEWKGDSTVGEGRMTITESQPHQLIRLRLEFMKPMSATNDVEYTFTPSGDQTTMTWTMSGKNNFVGKAFGLFMDIEKMCGDQFDQGLAAIKQIVETRPAS